MQLLVEIRDTGREHLAEYRRVTQEQLELSRQAVQRQEHTSRLYRRSFFVIPVFLMIYAFLVIWILGMLT